MNRQYLQQTMETASLITGIFSVISIFFGFSTVFGSIGIILALLSRCEQPLGSKAKLAIGLSAIGLVIGIIMLISAYWLMINGGPEYIQQLMQQYMGQEV